ncbi:MAG: sugar phosphate isomerase/epimerase [Deltaproteobacteria bacterium]|nr:sugar phosphate isomerase/epimerase [Deltaproteobacteria bacterium]
MELRLSEGDTRNHLFWSDLGISRLRQWSLEHCVAIPSINVDHFKLGGLTHRNQQERETNISILMRIIERSKSLEIERILIPLFDHAEIHVNEDAAILRSSLEVPLKYAAEMNVELCLETTLPAHKNLFLFQPVWEVPLRFYYDIGNSAAFGFNLDEELKQLGPWISGVHIKDRVFMGGNVPIGEGSVNFRKSFRGLLNLPYRGPWVLETTPGDSPNKFAKRHISFTINLLEEITGV